ncbi:MAG TPA: hypothetical protein VM369_11580 [Candidatus Binatia bacterium]|nr:hypothetical protein [Candidatus Binatia bacterium]
MIAFRRHRLLAVLLLCCVLPAAAAEVVAHPGHADASLTRSTLRGMFGMRLRAWPDGTPVRVFVLDDTEALHQAFCESVLQMFPYQLRQNWDRLLYSGTGQVPTVVHSEEEMLRRVASTPGAIGYVGTYSAPPRPAPAKTVAGKARPPEILPAADPIKVIHVR